MKVLVIGGNGNTGFRVVQKLKETSHDPLVMIRDSSQRPRFDNIGVATVLGDLEYPIDHAVKGCDAVIFAAGSGGKTGKDKTVLIDHVGAIRAAVAALVNDAKRFVMLSAVNAAADADTKITHYHRAKGKADAFVMTMDEVMDGNQLDWTILNPGGLHDDDLGGKVQLTTDIEHQGSKTSRDTLAAGLVACLDQPNTIGKRFAILDGDTPLDDALKVV